MCIVIDTNVLGPVFNKKDAYHLNFEPVLDWIFNGQGKIVYGGSKYLSEITKYGKLFGLLNSINKAVYIENGIVDDLTQKASEKIVHKDFDDQHLIGLLLASGCKLICTNDERAFPFIQHRLFFKSSKEPKIYHTKRNSKLLNPKYIAECCGHCRPSSNDQKDYINSILSIITKN
ncbi:hypothetical protein SAMN05216464_107149 [Mucilaginibacter pineti]|uniref:PIN domain-containing protein n=1 Tax=Mucilaginibacter pineti TaxID=1391627 RepID=A0A1G7DVW7_9SPHI|nr:hypothetical protein [Mucilaginibacter pineti]SDE55532.1 hypothetical protein SAMN05216464_107149 [Mucilaginibacter pineti]